MNRTMKAVVYHSKDHIALEDRPVPTLQQPDDAIVRVTLSTICSSDLHIMHGTVPRAKEGVILGHEFVGVVEQVGTGVTRFQPGDRVSVSVESFCGECFYCKRGFVNNCEKGGWELGCRIDGCQAEYVRVPFADQGMTRIPDSISDESALFVGDVLATGYWAAQIGDILPSDTLLVLGAGPTGLVTMMCAKLYGPARIIAVDINPDRLEVAKKNGLADITLLAGRDNVEEEVLRLTQGRGADRVFEVAGTKGTFEQAWKLCRPSGTVILVALYPDAQTLPLHQMYGKNLTFKTGGVDGCHCREILDLIAQGRLDTEGLLTHTFPLGEIDTAYDLFEHRRDNVLKVAVEC